MKVQPQVDYDVVIAGGGLVGSSLACALGGSSLRVLVVEAGPEPTEPGPDYAQRVSAITPGSHNFFCATGVWDAMQKRRMGLVREMLVWDAGGSGKLQLDSADVAAPCLAYIIENPVMQRALYERTQQLSNIDYLSSAAIRHLISDEHRLTIEIDGGKTVTARLIVGADGGQSFVRQWLQIPTTGWSMRQIAIVAWIRTAQPHNDTAIQRFLPTGPLAFLPLDKPHHCSIVWSADTDFADQLSGLGDKEFLQALTESSESVFGDVLAIGPRARFPLSVMHAEHTTGFRSVLVGDAAHRVHPLAGQGLNLGIADVAALAEVLLAADGDIGRSSVLRKYERWRAADTRIMVGLMDAFKRLYGSEQPLLQGARNFGMDIVNGSNVLKQLIMHFAAGERDDMPKTMVGGK